MPGGKSGAAGVEGAWTAGLSVSNKLAILATPGQFERYIQLVDLCATLLRRRLIDGLFYERIVSGDPVLSLARQVHRVGTTEWARKVYQMGDAAIPVAAASAVLGVQADTGTPVMKRAHGIDDREAFALARDMDISVPGQKKKERAPPKTMMDGIAIHPDEIGVESYSQIQAREDKRRAVREAALRGEPVHEVEFPQPDKRRMQAVDLGEAAIVLTSAPQARVVGGAAAPKKWRI